MPVNGQMRAALAGATAAMLWGLQEPFDKRLFRCDTRMSLCWEGGHGRHHMAPRRIRNPRDERSGLRSPLLRSETTGVSLDPRRLAVGMALAEHVALYLLTYCVDRFHPPRGEPGVPRLLPNSRVFGQATWRHALFGASARTTRVSLLD
jgi:hypothetical protein